MAVPGNTTRVIRQLASPAVSAALVVAALTTGCSAPHAPGPPDVVLIVIDTLRADHLSLYGYERATSPHLDRFAEDGVTYARAISTATWTVPAHGSLFTGHWPSYHGAERVAGNRMLAYPLNPEIETLAEILGARGYDTGAFVGNGTYVSSLFGFARGFEEFTNEGLEHPPTLARRVGDWITSRREPGFLFVNILDPHEPYEPPPPLDTRFAEKRAEFGTMITTVVNEQRPLTAEMRAHFSGQYDGEIALSDAALGAILARLKANGRYDDALVIVTSDHGELLGEHGLAGHGVAPFEPEIHVPLVVKYPGRHRSGERVGRRVSTLAIFATILQTLDIPLPPGIDSRPLDVDHPVWVEDISGAGDRIRVGYDGSYKLMSIGPRATAYDLAADPGEDHALGISAALAPLRAALAAFSDAPRPTNPSAHPVIDAEDTAKLRALGYLE